MLMSPYMFTGPSRASSFDPILFLQFAHNIARTASSEAEFRTCVGRAYYALFLSGREKPKVWQTLSDSNFKQALQQYINQRQQQNPNWRPGEHFRIIFALRHIDSALGNQLNKIYQLRLTADYNLTPKPPNDNWPLNWQIVDTISSNILPKIQAL